MKREVDPKLSEAVNKVNELFEKDEGNKYPIIEEWRASEKTLDELDSSSVYSSNVNLYCLLIKCSLLAGLYGALRFNKDIYPWALELRKFFEKKRPTLSMNDIEKELWNTHPEGINRACVLISKFFHFFVDKKRFPIFDSFALIALRKIHKGSDKYNKYRDRVDELTEKAGLEDNEKKYREIDRFLWIAGHYWSKPWSENWEKMFEGEKKLGELLDKLEKLG